MRVGIIGAGAIGQTVGRLLAQADHDVLVSWTSSDARLREAAAQIGPGTRTGSPRDAVGHSEMIVFAPRFEHDEAAGEPAGDCGGQEPGGALRRGVPSRRRARPAAAAASGCRMILVSGATGNVGGALVAALAEAGQPVRALSRGVPVPSWPSGVEAAIGDLNHPASLGEALDGVRDLFLLSGYAGTVELLTAGRDAGLQRVVLLGSGAVTDTEIEAETPSTNAIVAYNVAAEPAVRSSGLAWTVLRPSGFHSNALRWRPQLAAGDLIRGPWPDVAIGSIDPADIAAVATVALADGGYDSRALRLTGPEALTPAQRVAVLGEVLDRPLRFEAQDDDAARAEMLADGIPAAYVDQPSFASSPTQRPTRRPCNQPSTKSSAGPLAPSPIGPTRTLRTSDAALLPFASAVHAPPRASTALLTP